MAIAADRVTVVLLAAGRGERFGGDKLAAPFRGRPLGEHAAAMLAALNYGDTCNYPLLQFTPSTDVRRWLGVIARVTVIPADATAGQLADVVKLYFEQHPESRRYAAATSVVAAIGSAFPCHR